MPNIADQRTYLAEFGKLCRVAWPNNRTMTVVCHGHSVPAGYFRTPEVRPLESYPHLLRVGLAQRYPQAVINIIVTAIGGENSESGAQRFERDVLNLRPDVITIDYALNDRSLGLERSRKAWQSMIEHATTKGIKVILLTPTPDQSVSLEDPNDPLQQHSEQVRQLARQYSLGLVDSHALFQAAIKKGVPLPSLMSQVNHPNLQGHTLVAQALTPWFV